MHEISRKLLPNVFNNVSNNDLSDHIHKLKHNLETDIEVVIVKHGSKSLKERRYWDDKFMSQDTEMIGHQKM